VGYLSILHNFILQIDQVSGYRVLFESNAVYDSTTVSPSLDVSVGPHAPKFCSWRHEVTSFMSRCGSIRLSLFRQPLYARGSCIATARGVLHCCNHVYCVHACLCQARELTILFATASPDQYAPVTVPNASKGAVCSPASQICLSGIPCRIHSICSSPFSSPVLKVL